MKTIKIYKITIIFLLLFSFTSCNDFLEEEVYTQYDPETFLQTEEGINSVLVAAYDFLVNNSLITKRLHTLQEFPGDVVWEWGGGYEKQYKVFGFFKWDSETGQLNVWDALFQGIGIANSLLDNIDKNTILSPEKVIQLKAEAQFIRATLYYYLWEIYGTTPIITTAEELDLEPVRATTEEFDLFITSELSSAAANLPPTQDLYGKATKGAALAFLSRYYINTYQWDKAAKAAKDVMDLNIYFDYSGSFREMFAVENERNSEVIFTSVRTAEDKGNNIMNYSFPPKYPVQSNWANWGAQMVLFPDFINSYHPDDKRLEWMLFEYTDTNGDLVDCTDQAGTSKGVRCFKYLPDPNAINGHGNDYPLMRFPEVLLTRAEALNELNGGPSQESIDLLNRVRARAGVPLYQVSDFASKDELNDAILDEKAWEFVYEGLRRMDLIRHGKLISRAVDRGVTDAKDYMTLYPIPQTEINANPNLEQNPGYGGE